MAWVRDGGAGGGTEEVPGPSWRLCPRGTPLLRNKRALTPPPPPLPLKAVEIKAGREASVTWAHQEGSVIYRKSQTTKLGTVPDRQCSVPSEPATGCGVAS